MSLEFIIEENCPFKGHYENDLLYILDLMRKTYLVKRLPGLLSGETDLDLNELRESGIKIGKEQGDQTWGEIENYLAANRHCDECAGCPANSSGLDYGCYNRISYPISESFEQKIMENLPPEGTLAYDLLSRAMKDFPVVAVKGLKDFRRKGFTESQSPIQRVWRRKTRFSSEKIGSDFFLHLLFFSGDLLEVSHMTVLLLFLGIIPHGTTIGEFQDREYLTSRIGDSLRENLYSHIPEAPLVHSMSLSVLRDRPLAILM